jgi:hypothetical protein
MTAADGTVHKRLEQMNTKPTPGFTWLARSQIRRRCYANGYTPQQVTNGIWFAYGAGATDAETGFVLAMSRILYSDAQLREGVRYVPQEAKP